jgi:hypothetical protein
VFIFKMVIEGEEVMDMHSKIQEIRKIGGVDANTITPSQQAVIDEAVSATKVRRQKIVREVRFRLGLTKKCNHFGGLPWDLKVFLVALYSLGALGTIGLIISIVCVVLQ